MDVVADTQRVSTSGRPVAWVTGAGTGIGRALALQLVQDGWRVVASGRREQVLLQLCALAPEFIEAAPLDITDPQAVQTVVDLILHKHGSLQLAVLNAGTYFKDSAATFNLDEAQQMIGVNLSGTLNCLHALMPQMITQQSGHIAILSSVAGYTGLPGGAVYGATKSALMCLAQSLYPELKRNHVKITVISPGFVATPLTDQNDFPMPFIMPPEAAAEVIAKGLRAGKFEIAFPLRLVWLLKFLSLLPHSLRFYLTAKMLPKQ